MFFFHQLLLGHFHFLLCLSTSHVPFFSNLTTYEEIRRALLDSLDGTADDTSEGNEFVLGGSDWESDVDNVEIEETEDS